MRLAPRLLLTHIAPVSLLLLALVAMTLGLASMTRSIAEVRDQHLNTIDAEEELHRAAWDVEVAARRGHEACVLGESEVEVARRALVAASARLHRQNASTAASLPPRLRDSAAQYSVYVDRLLVAPSLCDALRSPWSVRARATLDEEMTEAWISRLRELHGTIERREEAARRIGTRAAAVGLLLAVAGLVAAGLVAHATARHVTAPLARLARAALSLGEGDPSPIPPATGPREVTELSLALERSRTRLLELDQLKQGFVASVSHELRTPLAKMREALSLLADGTAGPLSPRQARVVELAVRACEREVKIVSALLDLSRVRSGGGLQRHAGCDIDGVLRRAAEDERAAADEAGVQIALRSDGDVPPLLLDAPLVERAVANLVRNAVSVSGAGQTVRLSRVTGVEGPGGRPGRWLEVRVEDDGPGVPAAVRGTLFESFVTRPVGARGAGVGLGLAFTREVARAHGGDAALVERPGPGASFALWLPLVS